MPKDALIDNLIGMCATRCGHCTPCVAAKRLVAFDVRCEALQTWWENDRDNDAEMIVRLTKERDTFAELTAVGAQAAQHRDALAARCEALQGELEHQKAETTRAVLRYTVKGYTAGENADSKHWRERAEAAESRCEALTAERNQLGVAITEARHSADCRAQERDRQADVTRLMEARCQHLEQENQQLRAVLQP